MSPVLFALFLNYFMKYHSCSVISLEFVLEELYFDFKLLVLLNTDDTVIFVEIKPVSRRIYTYFMNMLDINYDKTKIMIFDTRNDDRFIFAMGENKIQSLSNSNIWG